MLICSTQHIGPSDKTSHRKGFPKKERKLPSAKEQFPNKNKEENCHSTLIGELPAEKKERPIQDKKQLRRAKPDHKTDLTTMIKRKDRDRR